jgi:hypothetical protein
LLVFPVLCRPVLVPRFTRLTQFHSTSIFSRLFTPKKPSKVPQEEDNDAATNSPRSPRSPTSLLTLPSPSPNSPRSFRPGVGQPPVFQRPAELGAAASGIILPKRKDGRDVWAANDNPLGEEPDAQELLKSHLLVAGWLDAGATAATGAEDGEPNQQMNQAVRKSDEQDQVNVTPAPAPPSPPPKVVLHIDTDTHKSLSVTTPAPVANHVAPVADDNDNDIDKEDRVPDLDPSASSTAGSPTVATHHTGEAVSSSAVKSLPVPEKDPNPPHVGTLLPTIIEPDAAAEDEERDQVGRELPSLSPPPEKKRRRSVLGGISRLGSRRFGLRRSNTSPSKSMTTATTTTTNASTGDEPERRRSFTWGRQAVAPAPTKADLARAEEKMVQPVIHTPATISAQIMGIEDEEQQRLADAVFG